MGVHGFALSGIHQYPLNPITPSALGSGRADKPGTVMQAICEMFAH